jgi:ABC-type nitrate/sulfonate/bicarbonate transport system ATPase subunit
MAFLELRKVSKAYGTGPERTVVLKDVDLSIEEGEFVAIVGFSGSGKTTLMSLIAGLIMPDSGEVLMRGKPVTGAGPDRGIVFQSYSLLPWLSVRENVGLGIDTVHGKLPPAEREKKIRFYVEMVNLTPAIDKRPSELSGGMRQRVSVARALALNPEFLLLDEPFAALDALTRGTLQVEVERIWRRDRKTVLLITNDVDGRSHHPADAGSGRHAGSVVSGAPGPSARSYRAQPRPRVSSAAQCHPHVLDGAARAASRGPQGHRAARVRVAQPQAAGPEIPLKTRSLALFKGDLWLAM